MNWHQKHIQVLICRQTKDVRSRLAEFDQKKRPLPAWVIEDLFDESNLYDPEHNKKHFRKTHIRLGTKYQAEIPELTEYNQIK